MKKASIVGLLAALALGCGSSDEQTTAATQPTPTGSPTSPTSPDQPSADRPKWKPKSEEVYQEKKAAQNPAQITRGELPDGFPSDLPIYPDAKPKTSMMVGGSGLVVLDSSAPMGDVLSHYREELVSQGWTVDSVNEAANGTKASLKAHKDARSATISINQGKDGAGSEIGIAVKGS